MSLRRPIAYSRRSSSPHPQESRSRNLIVRVFRRLQWEIGQRLSVRAKLTLWYAAMCALTLTLVGFGMKTALDYRTTISLDPTLQAGADRVASKLSEAQFYGPADTRSSYKAEFPQVAKYHQLENCTAPIKWYCGWLKLRLYDYSGTYDSPGMTQQVQIIAQGPIAASSQSTVLTQPALPLLTPGNRPAIHLFPPNNPLALIKFVGRMYTRKEHFLTVHDRGQTFRVYVRELPVPAQYRGVEALLEVMQNEKTYLQVQNDLTVILLVGLPIGILIALLAGWWIARAALRPIDRISRTVQTVGESQDLSRRVNFMGPQDEVGRLAVVFDDMLGRLEKAFEVQKRFIADASHELRTPLTAIRGNADLMTIAPPEERDLCLAAIRRESERMTRLVSDLLLLAEADVAEQPVHMQPVNLSVVLTDVYRSTLVVAGDRVDVLLECNDTVEVMADPDRVKQLILNLADNAVKFTPEGGSVTLSLRGEPQGATVEVSDSGIGIPAEDQQAIFERFYRVEESRARRGSGLGLAICAWIVAAHGGSISVRSKPDMGSTFTVYLPNRIHGRAPVISYDDVETAVARGA